jgi:hypothetical protein
MPAPKNLIGRSGTAAVAAVEGGNTGGGTGVHGLSNTAAGVLGESTSGRGVVAQSDTDYGLRAASRTLSGIRASSEEGVGVEARGGTKGGGVVGTTDGVVGSSPTGNGVRGEAEGTAAGVQGVSRAGTGVHGISDAAVGVLGESTSGRGVVARSDTDYGLRAASRTLSGIRASSQEGVGVEGEGGTQADGVRGSSPNGNGVHGISNGVGAGVFGTGRTGGSFEGAFEGVHAVGHDPAAAAVAAYNDNAGPAIYGKSTSGAAGAFDGDVFVTGHVHCVRDMTVEGDIILKGMDLAEQFGIVGNLAAEPGSVVVLAGDDQVRVSEEPYDRRVAGVVSGAGSYRPAIVLDRRGGADRRPLALSGKVWCKVDADCAPIELGDLLTTSPTPGHAMCAADPVRAFGAVIGKALGSLGSGRGLLPVLVALQ